ncbi:hypothetical protein HPB50_019861 [Hyalomma asiaticum]|uniref:Uncharacterized protein n=1 Tax=Hyalomma asiaticum TaxID=266040 RepID=A0ACB7RLW3_HYAAI|nr:hypothetical protein HPB50_019861 [Hyalomma asiaticum]
MLWRAASCRHRRQGPPVYRAVADRKGLQRPVLTIESPGSALSPSLSLLAAAAAATAPRSPSQAGTVSKDVFLEEWEARPPASTGVQTACDPAASLMSRVIHSA